VEEGVDLPDSQTGISRPSEPTLQGYEGGLTIAPAVRRAARMKRPDERQAVLERSTARLIRKVAKS
jgi:hypothetical protein